MSTATTTAIDVQALKRALATRDLDALAELYDPEARYELSNADHPPAAPLVAQGRGAIIDLVRAVPPDIAIDLRDAVIGVDGRVVLHVLCHLPSGGVVCSAWLVETRDGRITSQTGLEVADAG